MLTGSVIPSALTVVSTASTLLEESGGQIDGGRHAAGRPQSYRSSSQVGLAGVPPSRVGVGQSQASAFLLGRVLRRGQETGVKLSRFHPPVGHDEQGLPSLRAGALPASLPRHTQHRASHPAAVAQQAPLAPLDGGLGGVAVATVGRLVGHDPANGEAGQRRPDGEC